MASARTYNAHASSSTTPMGTSPPQQAASPPPTSPLAANNTNPARASAPPGRPDRLLIHFEQLQMMREERLAMEKKREAALRRKEQKRRQEDDRTRRWAESGGSDTDHRPFDYDSHHVSGKTDEGTYSDPNATMDLRARESRERIIAAWEGMRKIREGPSSYRGGTGGASALSAPRPPVIGPVPTAVKVRSSSDSAQPPASARERRGPLYGRTC